MIVGKEDFCDFKTLQEAVNYIEAVQNPHERITIFILEGVYKEQVMISRSHIHLVGIGKVTITYNAHAKQKDEKDHEIGTFQTATVYLDGMDVHLENLTIENSAGHGEEVGQAIALYANCDQSSFKNCRIIGHQDTLFTSCLPDFQKDGTPFPVIRPQHEEYRQYYSRCVIEGTVDFIFGGATAYFDQCLIKNKARKNDFPGYITAANTSKDKQYGFIFNECLLVADREAAPFYLGRPWRPYAKVRFQNCQIVNNIQDERWDDWDNLNNRETIEFEEVNSQQTNFFELYSDTWPVGKRKLTTMILQPEDVFTEIFY